jgi:hypothetical protein
MLISGSLYRLPETMHVMEPVPVPDTFAVGLHAIEAVGPCVRFVFFNVQSVPELRGEPCKIITNKMVFPQGALAPGMDATMRFMGLSAMLVGR